MEQKEFMKTSFDNVTQKTTLQLEFHSLDHPEDCLLDCITTDGIRFLFLFFLTQLEPLIE